MNWLVVKILSDTAEVNRPHLRPDHHTAQQLLRFQRLSVFQWTHVVLWRRQREDVGDPGPAATCWTRLRRWDTRKRHASTSRKRDTLSFVVWNGKKYQESFFPPMCKNSRVCFRAVSFGQKVGRICVFSSKMFVLNIFFTYK